MQDRSEFRVRPSPMDRSHRVLKKSLVLLAEKVGKPMNFCAFGALIFALCATSVSAAGLPADSSPARYRITLIEPTDPSHTASGVVISESGVLVLNENLENLDREERWHRRTNTEPIQISPGKPHALSATFGYPGVVTSLSSGGMAAGYAYNRFRLNVDLPVVWEAGKRHFLPLPDGVELDTDSVLKIVAVGVNDSRQAVGVWFDGNPATETWVRPLVWCGLDTKPILLPTFPGQSGRGDVSAINAAGLVVGWAANDGGMRASTWRISPDCKRIEGPTQISEGRGMGISVSETGRVAAVQFGDNGLSQGYIRTELGERVNLEAPTGYNALPRAIGPDGMTFGALFNRSSGTERAVAWDSGGRVIDLFDRSDARGKGWTVLMSATGADAAGKIVGVGEISGERRMFLLSPIPSE